MRLLVVGANGMLGSEAVRQAGTEALSAGEAEPLDIVALDLPEVDIADAASVARTVRAVQPTVILNCAAYTNVDGCESHRDEAFVVNAEGPRHLAEAARSAGALLVHVSTDFVFDGAKGEPYVEDDPPRPLSVYGKSKLAGEEAVRAAAGAYLIARTSWLFGPGGRNFVTTIVGKAQEGGPLRVVSDQTGSPTYAKDLALALFAAVARGLTGTYHLCNAGPTTWFGLASAAVQEAGLSVEVHPVSTAQWPRPARVPRYSVLSCEKARRDGDIALRPWREALREFVRADLGLQPGRSES
jgi:dTDP-4-dehydrorhamnose reductase